MKKHRHYFRKHGGAPSRRMEKRWPGAKWCRCGAIWWAEDERINRFLDGYRHELTWSDVETGIIREALR